MDTYLKTVGIAVIGILLCLVLSKSAKDYSVLLVIVLCCILCTAAAGFLKPIFDLLEEIGKLAGTGFSWLDILMKAAGLSVIGETVSAVCSDAGHAAVSKTVQLLTTVAILWVSLPLIQSLLELIRSVLEML